MSHNPNQFLMGATGSNIKSVDNIKGNIEAGLAVRLKSDGTPSVAAADGSLLGISLGQDLSQIGRTAVCRKGLKVPVKLATSFNPTVGAAVAISDTTGEAKAYTGTGDAYVNAVYATGRLSDGGIGEDGLTKGVALIDFPGGL